ncbi:autotransporter outer membrane beta-barrel domain-containing protein [Synechococcus sp. A15-60]|uniref:autotransporter outer membrane beta-barrel domain-containing protein n=1 Tax=Synechococcus sp. A15-60 TaxID=1050655 RepID=UPI0016456E3D|nr:autotransporter outer membrane beta-barrel domain-containing protein [Synechococcus sp. A15-60]QNI48966.1 filamentous hemagglutinin family outer membrane protein [Synechococcus sp. A15-60]
MLSLALSLSATAAVHAQVVPIDGGEKITEDETGVVEIYTLPVNMQTVIEGDDDKYYAINYYTYVNPKVNDAGRDDAVPGISAGLWWKDSQIGQFFPWGDDEDLAKRLSNGYEEFAENNNLLVDGDLWLNDIFNGGGFIFDGWKGDLPPGDQRPNNASTRNNGLQYMWNSAQYYTHEGPNNRIQAFGGCAVNTISSGEITTTSNQQLIKTAIDPCKFEDGKVREDLYAPVFQGGTLKTVVDVEGQSSNTNLDIPFWVGIEGGTVDNNGIATRFNGEFSDVLLATFSGSGTLNFQGSGITVLAADNSYIGDTNILEGTLRVTGSLSDATAVSVADGAIYEVANSDEVGSIEGAGDIVIEKDQTLTAGGLDTDTTLSGVISGDGGFKKVGDGTTSFSGDNTYAGATEIKAGTLKVTGSLSDVTGVSVSDGATYEVTNSDEIGSIEGAGDIVIDDDQTLTAGGLGTDTEFSGPISGDGGFTKVGDGTTTFSGANSYKGETKIKDGALLLGHLSSIPRRSSTLVTGAGRLDLLSGPSGRGEFEIDRLSIKEGGRVYVSPEQPLVSKTISLDAYSLEDSSPGGIITSLDGKNNPPLRVSESFDYENGSLVVGAPDSDDPEGVWEIIDGDVKNIDDLAENTYIVVSQDQIFSFDGIGEEYAKDGPALYKGYLAKGSLDLVIEVKKSDEIICDLHPDSDECNEEPNKPDPDPPICDLYPALEECKEEPNKPDPDPPICEGDECKNDKPVPLPGCEEDDDLCDVISDVPGDEDDAWEDEEEVALEIIEGLLDGLKQEQIDLLLSFDYGQLAKLVGSGLAPRNVDAAGRGLALHNNLLVDTLFDRQPLRQFEELLIAEEVVEQSVVEDEAVIEESAPVQPLWLKPEELSDGEAAEYVEGAVESVEVADADAAVAIEVEEEAVVVEFDGVRLVDQQDDELDLAKREGVSAWVKGFGGNSRADDSSILYNDYSLTAYGTSFGVNVALSETFQIGAYANYGDLNVNQHSGETGGGSWNPEGWGGGLTAQYSARHFYVQGLLGASEFSGEQSRNILRINDDLGGNTARGDKSVTSYLGALRIGAPFKTGGVVLEPQGQVVWTRNHEQGFSETSGTENLRLKYKSRTTNFAETELGMKLSVPIRTGERGLLVPSVRAAWLADWNQGNEGQEIGYKFTNKTVNFDSQLGTENGALIEAGLDYTVQNFNGISVKLYGRGGMEFWASDRGTTWRASGGMTWQF